MAFRLVQGIGNPRYLPPYVSFVGYETVLSSFTVANEVYLAAFWFPAKMSVIAISARVVSGNGENVRLGLYADNGNTPDGGALLADSGNMVAPAIGAMTFALPTPLALGPGIAAWLGFTCDAATLIHGRQSSLYPNSETGSERLFGANVAALPSFGPLPNPCPATTSNGIRSVMGALRIGGVG